MATPHAKKHGRYAVVDGYAADLVLRGIPFFEPRFMGLIEAPGERAHGVVFAIEDDAWAEMSRHEVGYRREMVTAWVGGEPVEALALLMNPGDAVPRGPCSRRYACKLLAGAEHHGLPQAVVAEFRRQVETGPRLSGYLIPLLWRPIRWLAPIIGPRAATLLVTVLAGVLIGGLVSGLLGLLASG
ncbi:MAG: gamma-glutamylcyclotransferase [Deltaproteobacteria bacterium]|nr:gamma-glutamylcyclotransferase [Deltaproteobacteria bacterium]